MTKITKGTMPSTTDVAINHGHSAVEDFWAMNQLCDRQRRTVPMTGHRVPFFSFNETDLVGIFMNNDKINSWT